jgi:transposase
MTHYLGVDLHKKTQRWVLLNEEDDTPVFSREYLVSPSEVARACKDVSKFGNIVSAIEPVCGWQWQVIQMREAGLVVHISNPRKTVMIAKSLQKTDKNDALTLALLVRTGLLYESMEVSPEVRKLRSLVRERSFLVQLRASTQCRLEGVVTREGKHLMNTSTSSKKGTEEILAGENHEWKRSVHMKGDITKYIDQIELELRQEIQTPLVKLLTTIPGVGVITALTWIAEIGDFALFPTPEKLCAFAGLVPTERSSGGVQRLGHITKAGSTHLRYMTVEAAMHIRNEPKTERLYEFYEKIKSKKGAMCARVALGRKMLSIAWYMVKKNEPYTPQPLTILSSVHLPMRGDLVHTL